MKKIVVFIAVLFTGFFTYGQALTERMLGTNGSLGATDMLRLDDGSTVFTCVSYPPLADTSLAVILKIDSAQQTIWAKRIKALRKDDFSFLTKLSDGNILAGGAMRQQFSLDVGASIVKIDLDGNVLWHKHYSASYDDRILRIFERSDHSLMIFIRHGVSNQPTKIIHADSLGNILSKRTYFIETRGVFAENVVTDENENYYLSGRFLNTSTGRQEFFICAINQNNLLWYKRYDFGRSAILNGMTLSQDQTIISAGYINDSLSPATTNLLLAKWDTAGQPIWSKEYEREEMYSEYLFGASTLNDGSFLATGYFVTDTGWQGLACKFNANGDMQWANGYLKTGTFTVSGAKELDDEGLLLRASYQDSLYLINTAANGVSSCSSEAIAFSTSEVNNIADTAEAPSQESPNIEIVVPPITITDISVSTTDICDASVGLTHLPKTKGECWLFPVPCHEELNVKIQEGWQEEQTEWRLFNAMGQQVQGIAITKENHQIRFNTSTLSQGVYWLELRTGKQTLGKRFIKK